MALAGEVAAYQSGETHDDPRIGTREGDRGGRTFCVTSGQAHGADMVDNARATEWEREARSALAQFYGTSDKTGNLAAIVLALLEEREALLRYVERSQAS
jgi:hypothetical protein